MPAALEQVGPRVSRIIEALIPPQTIKNHPFAEYCKNAMDVLLFDLFYYFIIHKRGKFDPGFSIKDFYKEYRNEHMYDR